ncbi:MAG: cytochrome d ubiquinol oxidase subunit II [Syntrophomonadaceae bacterium]|mgnify:CR=1 FL=1|nr:cytochrome d ubiquinol oxidase subunit II [Syntrophomonadaceae bacterium]
MGLNELWFILIAVLFAGFFFLEGFDFGVGMLMQWLGHNDTEKNMIIHSIEPFWGANEVWLLTAGGAMFAAFPGWYATMFSGYYSALFLVLAALIIRGVAIDFRGRVDKPGWHKTWNLLLGITSLLIPFLLAVALASLLVGVPINAEKEYVGNLFDLLSPPALFYGLDLVIFFIYHGAVFLTLKLQGELLERAYITAIRTGRLALVTAVIVGVVAALTTNVFTSPVSVALTLAGALALLLSYVCMRRRHSGLAFTLNGVSIIAIIAALFTALFPRVMVSSINESFSLTIYNISSSPYTLKVMTIVALTLIPVVLLYTAWAYYVFRSRITVSPEYLQQERIGYASETSV